VTTHPIGAINKKEVKLDVNFVQDKMCRMQGDQPSEICRSGNRLSTGHIAIIVGVMLVVFVGIMGLYKVYMHVRMRKEIKSEVDKTLEQYYRYMETF